MASVDQLPKYHELMNPLLQALHDLGGSGTIQEITEKVIENLNIPEELTSIPRDPEKSSQTEIGYRLAWARSYLKRYGVLDNSARGVWIIAKDKHHIKSVDPKEVVNMVLEYLKEKRESKDQTTPSTSTISTTTKPDAEEEINQEAERWQEELHNILINQLTPDAFERLIKRVLRESGFVQLEVTGRSGDGGIDGKGVMRIGGFLSFHVLFQCKKYKGAVSSSAIRDFRGALMGRADKGLFVTTGTFTRDAIQEATRDGATPIDLIDGDQLAEKLKELGLGIKVEMIESVTVDPEWYQQI